MCAPSHPSPARRFRLCEVRAEDYAFVLLSRFINTLEEKVWWWRWCVCVWGKGGGECCGLTQCGGCGGWEDCARGSRTDKSLSRVHCTPGGVGGCRGCPRSLVPLLQTPTHPPPTHTHAPPLPPAQGGAAALAGGNDGTWALPIGALVLGLRNVGLCGFELGECMAVERELMAWQNAGGLTHRDNALRCGGVVCVYPGGGWGGGVVHGRAACVRADASAGRGSRLRTLSPAHLRRESIPSGTAAHSRRLRSTLQRPCFVYC